MLRNFTPVLITVILLLGLSKPAIAAIEAVQFDKPEMTDRYHSIIAELRCLVCQNQNLADSDADLAKDLRRKASEMIKAGNSDDEILSYMQERYGDFVLYRPPFNIGTAVLWLGPFLLLLLAASMLITRIKRRQDYELLKPLSTQDEAQRVKVRNLMKNAPELTTDRNNPNIKESSDKDSVNNGD